jgi:Zn-dependent peptidase ImmA (M78 family)
VESDIPLIDLTDDAGQSFARRLGSVMTLQEVKQTDLATYAEVTDRAIRGWTTGVIPFKANLRSIEGYTGFSSAFFLAGHPASMVSGLNFWARVAAPKYIRGRFAAFAAVVGEVLQQILLETSLPSPELARAIPEALGASPENAASVVRSRFHLGDRAIDPLAFAEHVGVLVVFGPPEILNVDAYSAWVDNRPLIVLNPSRTESFRIWHAIAHELGHLFMHDQREDVSEQTRETRELEAEEFARAFLVPEIDHVNEALQRAVRTRSWDALTRLRNIYRVGVPELLTIAGHRGLERSGYITDRAVKYNAEGIGSIRTTATPPFGGPTTLPQAIANLCEAHGYEVDQFAEEVGVPFKLIDLIASRSLNDAANAGRFRQVDLKPQSADS